MKILCFILCLITSQLPAQTPTLSILSKALGGQLSTCIDASLTGNPTLLLQETSALSLSAENRYGIPEYSALGLSATYVKQNMAGGLSYSRWNIFNKSSILSLIVARRITKRFNCGLNLRMEKHKHEDIINSIGFDLGLTYQLNDKLKLTSLYKSGNRDINLDQLPALNTGVLYKLHQDIALITEVAISNTSLNVKVGGSVSNRNKSYVIGYDHNARTVSSGILIGFKKIKLASAFSWHSKLGISPSLSMSYEV